MFISIFYHIYWQLSFKLFVLGNNIKTIYSNTLVIGTTSREILLLFGMLYLKFLFLFHSPLPITSWAGWGTSHRSGTISPSPLWGTALKGTGFFSFSFSTLFKHLLFCNLLVRLLEVGDASAVFVFLPQNWENHMIIWNLALGAPSSSRVNIERDCRGLRTGSLDISMIEKPVLVKK